MLRKYMENNSFSSKAVIKSILSCESGVRPEFMVYSIRRFIGGVLFALLLMFFAMQTIVYAQTGPNSGEASVRFSAGISSAQFRCDNQIYVTRSGNSSQITALTVAPGGKSFTQQDQFRLTNPGAGTSTMALGPNPWNGKLTMYLWAYGGSNPPVAYIENGATSGFVLKHKIPVPGDRGFGNYAGGEVYQKTGELYLSGDNNQQISNARYRLAVMNPLTGDYSESGPMQPMSDADDFGSDGKPASDMAIDAEGNFYLIVGNTRDKRFLTKVERGSNASGWRYTKVRELTGVRSGSNSWGMAFLNGGLFMEVSSVLYRYDVLTGDSHDLGAVSGGTIYDLAACQTAPVIRGTVYADERGDGNVTSANKRIVGQDVEIWKEEGGRPTYKSTVQTNSRGEFSLLVDTTTGKYFVRLGSVEHLK